MKTKFKMMVVTAMALIIQATTLQAQNHEVSKRYEKRHIAHEKHPHKPKGMHILDLTDVQKEEIKALHISLEKESLPLRNQIREKEARLKTLTTSENYDQKATEKVIEDIGGLKTSLMKLKVSHEQSVRSLLTEEQLVFFNQHKSRGFRKKEGKKKEGKRG